MPEPSPKYMFASDQSVAMHDLLPMDFLVRLSRNEEEYEALKLDLQQNGQKIPIKTRPHPIAFLREQGKLEILDGMGRVEAFVELGVGEIKADVEDLTDEEAYKMAFTLNINRENLNALSIANWIGFLKRKFGMSNDDVCELTGRKRPWVSRHLAMIETQEEVKSIQSRLGFDPAEPKMTERQARAFRAASEPVKLDFAKQMAIGHEPPSAREMERASTAEFTPEEVLEKHDRPGVTPEFLIYLLQEDAGLTIAQAKQKVQDHRAPQRTSKGKKLTNTPNVWTKLSQYYPTEILDVVGNLTGSENFETLIKYCRRYAQKLYLKAPESLRQAVMEEWA